MILIIIQIIMIINMLMIQIIIIIIIIATLRLLSFLDLVKSNSPPSRTDLTREDWKLRPIAHITYATLHALHA